MFLQKWRAVVEVSCLRCCVDPNAPKPLLGAPKPLRGAPKEPLDADAQAEADGGDDEAPLDEKSDDGSDAGFSPRGSSPHSPQASLGEQAEGPGGDGGGRRRRRGTRRGSTMGSKKNRFTGQRRFRRS